MLTQLVTNLYFKTEAHQDKLTIEGFGGKRALGFLLKSELCQKRSKFRMQFCLHIFPREFSGDLLLNEKQKKPFVSLSDEVTIIASFSYYCFVSASG